MHSEWLFKRVSAVIHHGGAGTTACGLVNARPTLIVPFFGEYVHTTLSLLRLLTLSKKKKLTGPDYQSTLLGKRCRCSRSRSKADSAEGAPSRQPRRRNPVHHECSCVQRRKHTRSPDAPRVWSGRCCPLVSPEPAPCGSHVRCDPRPSGAVVTDEAREDSQAL